MKEITNGSLVYLKSEKINVPHAFTTRFGGVSSGIYTSLNLGRHLNDSPEHVSENYRIICCELGISPQQLVFSHQVHGCSILSATSAHCCKDNLFVFPDYEADALVTSEKGLALAVFTADCIPILLHSPSSGVIAAVHAGWRGTVADIAGKTVYKMVSEYGCNPSDIRAAIGPGIDFCCFETDSDVPDAVYAVLGEAESQPFIRKNNAKYFVDLKGVNRELLLRSQLLPQNIEVSDECTFCNNGKYWSHRFTHGKRGLQAAIITL